MTETLADLFPHPDDVRGEWRHAADDTGRTLLLDGRLVRWDGPTVDLASAVSLRDADGRLSSLQLGPAALADADAGRQATQAASRAWRGGRGEWPRASVAERVACVEAFLGRAAPLRERVARTLMWEIGKPYGDCLAEFDRTIRYVEDTIAALSEMEQVAASPVRDGGFTARIRRAPLGVCLCMGPYNYAINEVYTLVIPALLMGNPVVIKTPRYGVLANALLAPALAASFPSGAVSLVTGEGATVVGPMMESGLVDVLAFIGSARTASILLRQHPRPNRLRTVLGLGAKNTAIVLSDADLDSAADEIVSGALSFNGQRCTAIKLVLAVRSVAEALAERLAARIGSLKIGMPWEEGVRLTPLPPDEKHLDFLEGLVHDAESRGARIVNPGGGRRAGTLFAPALLYPATPEMEVHRVEQFGPLLPVGVVDDPSQAVDIIDAMPVGQQASVFGRDPAAVGPLVDHLSNLVCRVNLNTQCRRGPDSFPFTGRKDSAFGTLSLSDALRVFSVRSIVATPDGGAGLLAAVETASRFLSRPTG